MYVSLMFRQNNSAKKDYFELIKVRKRAKNKDRRSRMRLLNPKGILSLQRAFFAADSHHWIEIF